MSSDTFYTGLLFCGLYIIACVLDYNGVISVF